MIACLLFGAGEEETEGLKTKNNGLFPNLDIFLPTNSHSHTSLDIIALVYIHTINVFLVLMVIVSLARSLKAPENIGYIAKSTEMERLRRICR
jgi:hypothetical protein